MEQTLTFVLGVVCTLGIMFLGYTFIKMLKINTEIKDLQKDIEDLMGEISQIHRRIDEDLQGLERNFQEDIKNLKSKIDELGSYVDSRFDKHINKSSEVISTSYRNTYEKVEKLEELFKLQMDQFAKVTLMHSDRIAELETQRKIEEDKIEQINS